MMATGGAPVRPADRSPRARRFIGISDSHLHAVTAAWREHVDSRPGEAAYVPMCLIDEPFRPSFSTVDGKRVANPAWESALRENLVGGDDVSIFLFVGGFEYFRWSLTPGPRSFDFAEPGSTDDAPPVGQVVPYRLMMAMAKERFQFMAPVVAFLRTPTPMPLVQFAPPPPLRDMSAHIAAVPDLVRQTAEYGVSPSEFRARMWRLAAAALDSICRDLDISCAMPPAEAVDRDGFLRPEFAGDAMHANIDWGRLLVRDLLARATRDRRPHDR